MMFNHLRHDLNRYFILAKPKTIIGKIKIMVLTQGIWAICIYRAGSWCAQNRIIFVTKCLLLILTILQKMIEICTGISLPFESQIGRGLYIGHFGNIIIGPEAVIGNYCNLSQGVTIGQAGRDGKQLSPVIGDKVYIGPGAKIFGGINIGKNVAIGANAVVLDNIPDNAVVGGVPAKILNFNGSKDFIILKEKS